MDDFELSKGRQDGAAEGGVGVQPGAGRMKGIVGDALLCVLGPCVLGSLENLDGQGPGFEERRSS